LRKGREKTTVGRDLKQGRRVTAISGRIRLRGSQGREKKQNKRKKRGPGKGRERYVCIGRGSTGGPIFEGNRTRGKGKRKKPPFLATFEGERKLKGSSRSNLQRVL